MEGVCLSWTCHGCIPGVFWGLSMYAFHGSLLPHTKCILAGKIMLQEKNAKIQLTKYAILCVGEEGVGDCVYGQFKRATFVMCSWYVHDKQIPINVLESVVNTLNFFNCPKLNYKLCPFLHLHCTFLLCCCLLSYIS